LRGDFREVLKRIDNAELRSLLDEIDPTRGSGAEDFARTFTTACTSLQTCFEPIRNGNNAFDPPFTLDQVGIRKAGGGPSGQL
jgi:hypothetical protein